MMLSLYKSVCFQTNTGGTTRLLPMFLKKYSCAKKTVGSRAVQRQEEEETAGEAFSTLTNDVVHSGSCFTHPL